MHAVAAGALTLLALALAPRSADACICQRRGIEYYPPSVIGRNVTSLHVQWDESLGSGPVTLYDTAEPDAPPATLPPLVFLEGPFARIDLPTTLVPGHFYGIHVETSPNSSSQVAGFTVATTDDITPPRTIEVTDLDLAIAQYAGDYSTSCGAQLTGFNGTLSNLDPSALVIVRITGSDGITSERLLPPEPAALTRLGADPCSVATPLAAGTYDIEIALVDEAGNAGAAHRESITVRDCGVIASFADVRETANCVFRDVLRELVLRDLDPVDDANDDDTGDSAEGSDAGGCAITGIASPFVLAALFLRRRRGRP